MKENTYRVTYNSWSEDLTGFITSSIMPVTTSCSWRFSVLGFFLVHLNAELSLCDIANAQENTTLPKGNSALAPTNS